MVDLDPDKLYGYGLSPADVSDAINAQNLILPGRHGQDRHAGVPRPPQLQPRGGRRAQRPADQDASTAATGLHQGRGPRPRRVQVQTNIVHADGKRGVLLSILKLGKRLDAGRRQAREGGAARGSTAACRLKELKITPLFDQSVFVRASVEGVVKEAAIAAGLTALMILLFLGSLAEHADRRASRSRCRSWCRSSCLWLLGETLNVMTLGGMALAVGILVDDATVEIENIHRNLHQRKRLVQAILDGAQQIAVPAFVSTLCICIVFVPVVFISGAGQVPVHAAGDGGRLRDDDQLPAQPHAGADDGALPAGERGRAVRRRRAGGIKHAHANRASPRRLRPVHCWAAKACGAGDRGSCSCWRRSSGCCRRARRRDRRDRCRAAITDMPEAFARRPLGACSLVRGCSRSRASLLAVVYYVFQNN